MGPGIQEATPLVYDGVMYLPNPSDLSRPWTRPPAICVGNTNGSCPRISSKFLPVPSINRNLAIYGNQIIDTSADDFVFALDAHDREAGVGNSHRRLSRNPRAADFRTDHRQRQDLLGPRLRAQVQPRRLHHHRARRQNRQGTVAHANDPQAWRARR